MKRLMGVVMVMMVVSIAIGQNLPQFQKSENRELYQGMYNDIILKLNGADPTLINVKCKDGQMRVANDTTYQVFLRNIDNGEVKLKLYYKNLPVDIYTLEIGQSPKVEVSVDGPVKSFYTVDELFDLKLKFSIDDRTLDNSLSLASFKTVIVSETNNAAPFMVMNTPNFLNAKRLKHSLKSGDKLLISDVTMKNRLNQSINCQSNYIEFKIK